MDPSVKRLLVVSWSMPPVLGARSVQVGRTLQQLRNLDWQISSITVDPLSLGMGSRTDEDLGGLYRQGIEVISVPASKFRTVFQAIRRYLPSLALVPDDERIWSRRAEKAALTALKKQIPDALVTFANPWSDHLIGLNLKRKTGLPWLAHFSDPWSDNPYFARYSSHQIQRMRDMEAEVIDQADAVIFTNSQTFNLVMRKYPDTWHKKAYVIPHGYDRQNLGHLETDGVSSKRLQLVFTGQLYGLRNPETLFEAVRSLQKSVAIQELLHIRLVGSIKYKQRYKQQLQAWGLGDTVSFEDFVPYQESLAVLSSADVLLLIDAPTDKESVFLPSKLVDYLMFRKPILGITPDQGASADLLREIGGIVVHPNDVEGIRNALTELIEAWQINALKVSPRFDEVAAEYDIRHTTQQFSNILMDMIS